MKIREDETRGEEVAPSSRTRAHIEVRATETEEAALLAWSRHVGMGSKSPRH